MLACPAQGRQLEGGAAAALASLAQALPACPMRVLTRKLASVWGRVVRACSCAAQLAVSSALSVAAAGAAADLVPGGGQCGRRVSGSSRRLWVPP